MHVRESEIRDKPFAFAIASVVFALVVACVVLLWAQESPERVLIGLSGRHDGKDGGERLAACLDCHVPFVGTPGSRCLGPGCHGELATGAPPKGGPAMPIRFHVVLREAPCGTCHDEHVEGDAETSRRSFTHAIIPRPEHDRCVSCHSGAGVRSHPKTDAVNCRSCHETQSWRDTRIDHAVVLHQPCDLCHVAPPTDPHASIAGTCAECHVAGGWKAKPAP